MKTFNIIINAESPDAVVDALAAIKELIESDSDCEEGNDEGYAGSYEFSSTGEYD